MPGVLFIAPHRPDRNPSQRFRFEQYISYLEANGWECELLYIITEEDDAKFYKPRNYFSKLKVFLKSRQRRKQHAKSAKDFDIVFVQREAFMTGSIRFERLFKESGAKLVFDFDDSIWLPNVSDANKRLNFLKNPEKTSKIIEMSDMVFAGNDYLREYALKFNQNVKLVPTTIDTDYHVPQAKSSGKIIIGWTGSATTIQHFKHAIPVLKKIKERYGDRVEFKVIGDADYRNDELGITGIAWTKEREIAELVEIDLGIMPLPDDEWAKGKCGLKGLQYMALGIPTVMSPVGVNSEIIADGDNGFLAASDDEWESKLIQLIENTDLRTKLGEAGRKTVVERYSVIANRDKYLKYFAEVIQE